MKEVKTPHKHRTHKERLTDVLGCKLSPLIAFMKNLEETDDNFATVGEYLLRDFDNAQQMVVDAIQRDIGEIRFDTEHRSSNPEAAHRELVKKVNQ